MIRSLTRFTIGFIVWALAMPGILQASEYPEGDEHHIPTVVADLFVVTPGHDPASRAQKADLDFARNMMKHHRAAVDMALAYLRDPRGTNPLLRRLARTIIHNQEFEVAVLDVVRQHVEAGPKVIAAAGSRQVVSLSRGWEGLEHRWQFVKAEGPGALDLMFSSQPTSEFDVQFARPMIEHHSAAVDMAMKYNTNPDGRSALLGPLNYNIMIDQKAEIDFLRKIVGRYPGDARQLPDDPKMSQIMKESMDDMGHGGHH